MDNTNNTTSFLFEQQRSGIRRNFSLMLKVCGPVCNLDCDYCYYLEKEVLYPGKNWKVADFRMPEDTLGTIIRDYIGAQAGNRVEFIWHGGEPSLLGTAYFRKALEMQKRYAGDKEIANVFQTNGTLITDEWAEFLAANNFLCGLSIDGPQRFHDRHRRHVNGKGSWEQAVECARIFQKHGVEFNTMTVVNAENSKQPAAVYEFLKSLGSRYLQLTPIVERIARDEEDPLSIVSDLYTKEADPMVENVSAADWGNFLCRVFDLWVKTDVGHCYVNYFDNTLAAYAGQPPHLCSMAPYCGCSLAVEHNGDAYCCDHFVFPEYKVGNIHRDSLTEMVKSDKQLFFEERKKEELSRLCRECEFLPMCGGDCPKNRFDTNKEGESVSVLCEGFRTFFHHTRKHFEFMAEELRCHRAPANIMKTPIR